MADGTTSAQLFELWRRQFDEAAQAWSRLAGQTPTPPTDPMAFWRPVLNQGLDTWARLFAQTPLTPDLATQWKQFLDQWIAAWSRVLEQAMGTDTFAKAMGKQMESFLNVSGPAKKAAEQQIEVALSGLGIPSRTQVTALARHLAQVEEKIDGLEDRLDRVLRRLENAPGRPERA